MRPNGSSLVASATTCQPEGRALLEERCPLSVFANSAGSSSPTLTSIAERSIAVISAMFLQKRLMLFSFSGLTSAFPPILMVAGNG